MGQVDLVIRLGWLLAAVGTDLLRFVVLSFRFVLHDRDSIFSPGLDAGISAMGVRVLRTPVQAPVANAHGERLLGSLRREGLDFLIPVGEAHLPRLLRIWQVHYNRARPHSQLGPGLPQPSAATSVKAKSN